MKGDLQAAFESIKGVPDTIGEPRFFAYRASLLLAVGRVDEASKDIERALSLNPNVQRCICAAIHYCGGTKRKRESTGHRKKSCCG